MRTGTPSRSRPPPRICCATSSAPTRACAAARAVREGLACPSPACPRSCASDSRRQSAPRACATTATTRVAHAVGRSYPDLVRIRSGDASSAPDAVVPPGSAEVVAAVLGLCAEHRVAVVPFGGGTSVVGGVEPLREGFAARGLARSRPARGHGGRGPRPRSPRALDAGPARARAGAAARDEGVTLGHFPQSFEYSTRRRLGGHALRGPGLDRIRAHRRAGEAVRCVTPAGELATKRRAGLGCRAEPARAGRGLGGRAGRDLRGHAARAARARRPAATRPGRSPASRRAATRSG